jgi:hypothetical protein
MIKPSLLALLLITGCATSSIARADALLDFVDDASGGPQTRLSLSGNKLRVDIAGTGAFSVVDLQQRTLMQVNVREHAYTITSIEQVQAILQTVHSSADPAAAPLVQLAMENLPEAQRQQAEQMLRQSRADEAIPYRKTGARSTVLEIPCEVYQQRSSSGDLRTLCVAAFADLKLAPADRRSLESALALLRETGGPWVRAVQVPGLPLRYSGSFGDPADGGGGHLKTLSQSPLPAAHFSVPADYRIVSILEMLQMSGAMR